MQDREAARGVIRGNGTVNACVLTGDGYGNQIMATPVVAALASMGWTVDMLITHGPPGADGLFAGWDAVRAVHTGSVHGAKYDLCYVTRWGKGAMHPPAARVVSTVHDLAEIHETELNIVPAREHLGYAGDTPPCHVETDTPTEGGYIVLAPGHGGDRGYWARKAWPHWAELGRLAIRAGRRVLVLGARDDSADWTRGYDSRCGTQSIRAAATIIRGAAGVIACDNGLAHIAAALGVPTVVLFGATTEVKKRPLGARVVTAGVDCRPCQHTDRWAGCSDWRCMADIRPGDVWAQFEEVEVCDTVRMTR